MAGGHRGHGLRESRHAAPANQYGYTLLQTEVNGFERDKKLVRTAHGLIEYDFLILSGGIRNDYEAWFGNDQRAIEYTRTHFPNAYIPNQEMLSLKSKVNFKGGTLVMTLPPPHRCPPSPYERACLIAWHIKKNKIPGKILILDPKPKIAPIGVGYKQPSRNCTRTSSPMYPMPASRKSIPSTSRSRPLRATSSSTMPSSCRPTRRPTWSGRPI